MSGHNKWSKIKHKKASSDAKKSKIFSMYSRLISIESKASGGNTDSPGLRSAIDQARAVNMPKDNIERAIKKGAGAGGENYEQVVYEAYGPGGVAMIIEGITDNTNRTTPEIKHLLSSNSYALGAQGSATWAFEKKEGEWIANTKTPLSDDDSEKLSNLIEQIEEHDDIKKVFTNKE